MKAERRLPSWVLAVATATICAGLLLLDRTHWFPAFRLAVEWTPNALPSSGAVPQVEVLSGLPILSLAMDETDLYSPEKGLLANKLEHGPEWERPGSMSYFEGGRLLFASGVGVRVHGGGSRVTSPRQGFRLYFRRQYGARQFAPGILFGPDAQPIRRLVVHNDVRRDFGGARLWWHLVNPLAYDIARAMGAIAPETKPVRFFLNGEYYGVFVLTERIDERFFDTHWGYDEIQYDQEAFDQLWEWVGRTPLTMDAVAKQVNLESLTRWFLAVAFCATGDTYQGPGQFQDLTRTESQWFWVNWDMDLSFREWNLDSYQYLLEVIGEARKGRNRAEPRATILTRLLEEDEAYRNYFKRTFQQIMNHRVTDRFLEERYQHYLDVATKLRIEDLDYLPRLHEFLAKRREFFRQVTEQWLNSPPSQPLTLAAPVGRTLLIDGESIADGYEGLYFPDLEVVLDVPAEYRDQFSGWVVNGRPVSGARMTLKVDRPIRVEARFGDANLESPPEAVAETAASPAAPTPRPPMAWRRIPTGTFWIGCVPGDQDCSTRDEPRQQARIDQPFEMTEREISAAEFDTFAADSGRPMPRQPVWYSDATHPVVNVTWDEAQSFCESVGGSLPTETQWEYAARGGVEGRVFPWGSEFNGEANAKGGGGKDRWDYTAPTGSFEPNAYGLRDMVGNVWEWTSSPYQGENAPARADAPDERTIRGGSWINLPPRLRLSYRLGLPRGGRYNLYVGFRCIRPARQAATRTK